MSFSTWSPPTFRIIFFQFSPNPPPNIIISDLEKSVNSFDLLICTSPVRSIFYQRHLVNKWKRRIIKRGKSRTAEKLHSSNTEVWDDRRTELLSVAIILSMECKNEDLALAVSRRPIRSHLGCHQPFVSSSLCSRPLLYQNIFKSDFSKISRFKNERLPWAR